MRSVPRWKGPALERRSETEGPESLHAAPFLRNRVVEPRDGEPEEIRPERRAEGLQRCPDADRVVPAPATPLERAPVVPREPDVVKQGALERRHGCREAERRVQDRESDLDAAHPD